MKRFFTIAIFCISSLVQANQQEFIMQIRNLAQQAPDRKTFIDQITRSSKKNESIFNLSHKLSPRLYATLQRAKTSLVFTDHELDKKLYELELEQELLSALESKNLTTVYEAINNGANVNTTTSLGHTPLMLAVLKADQYVVENLIKRGARVDKKGAFSFDDSTETEQMSALDLAQRVKHRPIVEFLQRIQ